MPTSVSSSERLWGALRDAYFDDSTPGEVSSEEWHALLKPAVEAKPDLDDHAVEVLRTLSVGAMSSPGARESIRQWLESESSRFRPAAERANALSIVSEGRDAVSLRSDGVFTSRADGALPSGSNERASAIYRAAKHVEGGYRSGGGSSLFGDQRIDSSLKERTFAELQQVSQTLSSGLDDRQLQQLHASVGALLVDLLRSLPTSGSRAAGLQRKVFDAIHRLISDETAPAITRHLLVGQMQTRDIRASLLPEQRAVNDDALELIAPKTPMNYPALARRAARDGQLELNVHDTMGQGEGFLAGFALKLERAGWERVSGELPRGPVHYQLVLPADDPRNAWGVPFNVNYTLQHERGHDTYAKMADPKVDIVAYGGHSNLGRNKLNALEKAPRQQGDKLILSDSCANSDGMDVEYARYPHAQNVSSNQSTYFRRREHPEYGEIAYDSEGFHMKMTVIDGILSKRGWQHIGDELERRANWWGHGTPNNWITPDAWERRFREVDGDDDGISDLFDLLPSFNTFDIEADTAAEFDLRIPKVPADEITANRAFQATRALNSFVNYNPSLDDNVWREVVGDAEGMFFRAREGDTELVRFRKVESPDGRPAVAAQFSSALADMSVEALRFVLFHEYVMHEHSEGDLGRNISDPEAKIMAALFATSSLKYDRGWRDSELFENAKRLLNLPEGIRLWDLNAALSKADDERNNLMGDLPAVRELARAYKTNGVLDALRSPRASRPQTPARLT